jgi:diguanylate cyclase (GGDEF)-like protein/PAS domain S-box-containing protein
MLKRNAQKLLKALPREYQLAQIDVQPAHRNWFARETVNHILRVSIATEIFNAGILFAIAIQFTGLTLSCALLGGGLTLIATSIASRSRLTKLGNLRHYRELSRLKLTAVIGGIYWGFVIGVLAILGGPDFAQPLTLMAACLMIIGCIKYVSVPYVGAANFASIAIGASIGMAEIGTRAAVISIILLVSLALTLYSTIFNLFYSFATRRLRTRTLKEAKDTIEILLNDYDEQGSDWLWEVDSEGRVVQPSQRFREAADSAQCNLSRSTLTDLFAPSQERDRLQAIIAKPEAFRRIVVELNSDGAPRWWSLSGRPSLNKYGEVIGLRGVATDVTDAKQADAKIAYMAHYDSLTDLPNRVFFNEKLSRALARRQGEQLVAVLYLDLDRFKSINDAMGHDMGDQVLKITADRINAHIGMNAMAARFGGDEFAILVVNAPAREDVVRLSLNIIDALSEPIMIDNQQISSGTSIGIAFAGEGETTAEDLLKHADLALYDAKGRGGSIALTFHPKMYEAMLVKRSIEADLGAAILQNELELYYQPLICIKTNETVAYEALLRWNHKTRGQIQPSVFIPIAEETGLIVQIGEWVIRNALAEVAKWPEHLSVSVNLSPVQMRSPNIIPTIVTALARSGVSPDRLEIEITESVLMNDSEPNLALLHRFKSLGIRISLDDFGTGYSSLNYLRSFPFDKIKIDRCFVEDIADRADCQAIIHAVLSLASSLNMTTTAEGIENEEQLALLRADGCDQAQGYLFSRPVPANTLPQKPLIETLENRLLASRTRAA